MCTNQLYKRIELQEEFRILSKVCNSVYLLLIYCFNMYSKYSASIVFRILVQLDRCDSSWKQPINRMSHFTCSHNVVQTYKKINQKNIFSFHCGHIISYCKYVHKIEYLFRCFIRNNKTAMYIFYQWCFLHPLFIYYTVALLFIYLFIFN